MRPRQFLAILLVAGCAGRSVAGPGHGGLQVPPPPPVAGVPAGVPPLWQLTADPAKVDWFDPETVTASAQQVLLPLPNGDVVGIVDVRHFPSAGAFWTGGSLLDGGEWWAYRENGLFTAEVRTNDGRAGDVGSLDATQSKLLVDKRDDTVVCNVGDPRPRGFPTSVAAHVRVERPSKGSTITILPLYTQAAFDEAGGSETTFANDIRAKTVTAGETITASCPGVLFTVFAAKKTVLDATESDRFDEVLAGVVASTHTAGPWRDAKAQRRKLKADIVLAVVTSKQVPTTIEGAWTNGDGYSHSAPETSTFGPAGAHAKNAFSLVNRAAFLGIPTPARTHLGAHEIGHIFGCGHEDRTGSWRTWARAQVCSAGSAAAHGTVMSVGSPNRDRPFSRTGSNVLGAAVCSSVCAANQDNVGMIYTNAAYVAAFQ